eukprot:CAMPEP_0184749958 /NCGR_PEP_ID=MMETSP0315-20130426/32405_1 /TAXON_ID=101924 /ORGANISM="Rhodosorus marinus, Strain UTEX LB 2760" /LENGTH=54 /DNA_ID=CAMNT_0027227577 /DNA_START=502 /DNA_END=666 /DNA_ORIENTATION=+
MESEKNLTWSYEQAGSAAKCSCPRIQGEVVLHRQDYEESGHLRSALSSEANRAR